MAEDKKSFILYADIITTLNKLSNEQAGILFKTILDYVNDKNPEVNDLIIDLAFEPIKNSLKRDLKKWEDFRKKQSENGKLGGRPSKSQKTQPFINESQKSLSVSANANDSVNENETTLNENQLVVFEDVCSFFEYSDTKFKNQRYLIECFIFTLPHKGKHDFFVNEFANYKKLKTLDGYKHSLNNFLGNQDEQFLNGKWDDNWTQKLKDYQIKNGLKEPETTVKKETALQKHRRLAIERNGAK